MVKTRDVCDRILQDFNDQELVSLEAIFRTIEKRALEAKATANELIVTDR
jgi:hypothetical protein